MVVNLHPVLKMNEYGVDLWPEFKSVVVENRTNHSVILHSKPKEWCLKQHVLPVKY